MFFSKSPNSRVEFGEFSKLKCWVWRILQTQIQKKKIWVWRILQTQVQDLQTHLFLKKMNWRKKTNSEAQRFSRSPMSRSKLIFFWKPWTRKKTQRLRLSPVWVQKVVRVSREQNFATRKQVYSWESSREGGFSNLCCQNLQAYMWPARLYCCCFCKWIKLSKLSKLLRVCVWRIP